jgi:hypothetical protein
LLLNFAVRAGLERHHHVWYFDLVQRHFSFSWSLLLPVDISQGQVVWITSSFYPIDVLCRLLGASGAFYALNALVILAAYLTAWHLSRSLVFTNTMALGMALGTQFHYGYVLSGTFVMYLQVTYMEVATLCAWKMLTAERTGRWRAAFLGTVVFLSLGFDTWLNYYVFAVAAGAFLYAFYRRRGEAAKVAEVRFALVALTAWLAVWLPVKLYTGRQHFTPGREDEVILGYSRPVLAAEDFLSNVITYTFMAGTNYLPPALLTSNSDFRLGPDRIMAEQHGYHAAYSSYVAMHHLFYWYYGAGALFAACLYVLVRSLVRALRDGSAAWAVVAVALLGVGAGAATHVMIKYRPYMSVPALSYKCMPGILACTYLLAFALMRLRQRLRNKWLAGGLVLACWAVMVYAGLTRPALLSHLQERVGLARLPVDPAHRLSTLARRGWHALGLRR